MCETKLKTMDHRDKLLEFTVGTLRKYDGDGVDDG